MLGDVDFENELIGAVYQCALEPSLWSETLERLCVALSGHSAGIVLLDYDGASDRLVRDWGPTKVWGDRIAEVLASIKRIHRQFLGIDGPRSDEIILLPRDLAPQVEVFSTPFYEHWARPQNIHQVLETIALSEPSRLGLLCVTRRVEQGEFSSAEIAALRRLGPHIRRAITISDLLDLRTVERNAFEQVVDSLTAGVCIVGAEGKLLHANDTAKSMLKEKTLVRVENGQLKASGGVGTHELMSAVDVARTSPRDIGASGIGVPLRDAEGRRAVAHVLPLACGQIQTRLIPDAVAGVFITMDTPRTFSDLDAIARSFEFTPADPRLVACLLTGETLRDSAAQIGIAETTARTQLASVFAKCGVYRQAEMLSLISRLMPVARVAA